MSRLALTGALAALAICAAPRFALASDADVIREYRDRAEIDALMWHYVHALDSLDESTYAANYTPDGSFKAGKSVSEGTEALKKIITDVKQRRAEQEAKGERAPQLYHVITNEHVEFLDKDHARIHSYWQTLFGPADPKARPQVAAAGRGIDEVVRVKGHWLIKKRDVMPPAGEW
jgi:hypothetical protein